MKRMLACAAALILGLALMGAALFAQTAGLDTNARWGAGRSALLILGVLLALGSLLYFRFNTSVDQALRRAQAFVAGLPLAARIRSNPDFIFLARLARASLFTLPVALLVLGIYLWFCTANLWGFRLPGIEGYYYDLQAQSYRAGQLSLPIKPSPQLLALSDPYDPQQRRGLTVQTDAPLDFALYQGKFYEYWGPVPAVVTDLVRPFYHGQFHDALSDIELIFGFLCGLFLCEYLLILVVWERFFRRLPGWVLLLSILLAGLVNPSLDMLTRMIPGSSVMVYQVAIVAGQCFLVAGLLWAWVAIDRESPSGGRLALAGCCWALAVGSRNILVVPVVFFALMLAYRLYRSGPHPLAALARGLISLGIPLACGALALSWYNWARFGSFGETGVSYMIAGPYDLQKYLRDFFSPIYIPQNLYNYLLMPFQAHAQFPFLSPLRGKVAALFPSYPLPAAYTANQITGLLFSAPFSVFALVPLGGLASKRFRSAVSSSPDGTHQPDLLLWLLVCLAGGFLGIFATLQIFLWAAMRYIEDFMPLLILLSLAGFWLGLVLLGPHSNRGRLYAALGVILALVSIGIGFLLPIGSNVQLWLTNPLLLGWLSHLFLRH